MKNHYNKLITHCIYYNKYRKIKKINKILKYKNIQIMKDKVKIYQDLKKKNENSWSYK